MSKSVWHSILAFILCFLIIWNFILPLAFRRKLQQFAFISQAPIWSLSASLHELQSALALNTQTKNWWIKKARILLQENAYLKLQLAENKDVLDMARRILELNKIEVGESFKCLPARVIYRSYETWAQYLVIDKGLKDGIQVGQGVICTKGIVGKISQVKEQAAFVELVTNPNFQMLVWLEGNKEPYKLQAMFNKKGWTHALKAKIEDITEWDEKSFPKRIETTFLGQQFPNHIYVGHCIKVKRQANKLVGIVQLGEYLKWLDEVGILIPITKL